MPQANLTDTLVAGLKPETGKQIDWFDLKNPGLALRVSPGGTKTWLVRYVTDAGERRRMKLGTYPATRLADARSQARDVRNAVEKHRDPVAERAAAKARSGTLDFLAEEYFIAAAAGHHGGRGRPKRARTLDLERQRYEAHAAPALGKRDFADLVTGDIRGLERRLRTGKAPLAASTAAGVISTVRSILAFAVHEERLPRNVAAGVVQSGSLPAKERRWSGDDARRLYRALAAGRAYAEPITELLLRLLVLTLVRRDEARLADWSEMDLGAAVWTVPGERTKNGRTHLVPLSPEAVTVLRTAQRLTGARGFVFGSPRLKGLPINKDVPYVALQRTCVDLELPRGGVHDWRRTAATIMTSEECAVPRFIVSLLLSHTGREGAAVTALYDLNDYLPEKRDALTTWANWLTRRVERRADPGSRVANDNG